MMMRVVALRNIRGARSGHLPGNAPSSFVMRRTWVW